MKEKSESIKRVELSIPRNENTAQKLDEIREYVIRYFHGATQIFSQLGGFWIDPYGNLLVEDIVLFIIYYQPKEYPEAQEVLKYIAKILVETGEEESWVIYQDAKRIIYSNKE